MTLCANILRLPTLRTTSHSSRWRRSTFNSVSTARGCLSEVCASLAGDGGRSPSIRSPMAWAPCPKDPCSRNGGSTHPQTESICKEKSMINFAFYTTLVAFYWYSYLYAWGWLSERNRPGQRIEKKRRPGRNLCSIYYHQLNIYQIWLTLWRHWLAQ